MFTEEDYKKYFQAIQGDEDLMAARFLEYSEKVNDNEIKKIFLQLHREEQGHGKVAASMLVVLADKGLQR